jgi:hypothetical protein
MMMTSHGKLRVELETTREDVNCEEWEYKLTIEALEEKLYGHCDPGFVLAQPTTLRIWMDTVKIKVSLMEKGEASSSRWYNWPGVDELGAFCALSALSVGLRHYAWLLAGRGTSDNVTE